MLGKSKTTSASKNQDAVQDTKSSGATPVVGVPVDDLEVMARTIFGEARGESWLGKLAVGWVVRNRADIAKKGKMQALFGNGNIASACKVPKQFSCWNENDPNRRLLLAVSLETDVHFKECFAAAAAVISGYRDDPTNGATHYHTKAVDPTWDDKMTIVLQEGKHIFYR